MQDDSGNLEALKWLFENKCPWHYYTFASAALNGNLENMKWLLENKCPWNIETFDYAAMNGNFKNIKWTDGIVSFVV